MYIGPLEDVSIWCNARDAATNELTAHSSQTEREWANLLAARRGWHAFSGNQPHGPRYLRSLCESSGIVKVRVLDWPGKTSWLALTNSIVTLCCPGGRLAISTVLLSLASAHHQGKSSTMTCRCPRRGDAWRHRPRTRERCAGSPPGTGPRRRPVPGLREEGDPRSAWVRARSRSRCTGSAADLPCALSKNGGDHGAGRNHGDDERSHFHFSLVCGGFLSNVARGRYWQ